MADDAIVENRIWQIEYSDASVKPMASTIATDLQNSGVLASMPTYKPPRDPTLGTPEVIITILVTAAAKAIIVSGLHALERYLQTQADSRDDRRVHVILVGTQQAKQHFPISLQEVGKDALKEFVSDIASAVNKL